MIFTLPYQYAVIVTQRGKPAGRSVVETVTVDIPEIEADEMPIAARWTKHAAGGGTSERLVGYMDDAFHAPTDLTVEILRQLEQGEGSRAGVDCRTVLRDERAARLREAMLLANKGTLGEWMSAGVRKAGKPSLIVSSERDRALANVTSFLADLVLVDGVLWKKSLEPVIVLHNPHGEARNETINHDDNGKRIGALGITCRGADYDDRCTVLFSARLIKGPDFSSTFRLDAMDEVMALIGDTAAPVDSSGLPYEVFNLGFESVEVLMPEAFEFDSSANDVARSLERCMAILTARKRIGAFPAFDAVRGHCADWYATRDPAHLARAVDMAGDMFAETGRKPTAVQAAALESLQDAADRMPISIADATKGPTP